MYLYLYFFLPHVDKYFLKELSKYGKLEKKKIHFNKLTKTFQGIHWPQGFRTCFKNAFTAEHVWLPSFLSPTFELDANDSSPTPVMQPWQFRKPSFSHCGYMHSKCISQFLCPRTSSTYWIQVQDLQSEEYFKETTVRGLGTKCTVYFIQVRSFD